MKPILICLKPVALIILVAASLLYPHAMRAAPTTQTPPFSGTVTDNANLRSGPGTSYERVGGATAGQTVAIVKCDTGCEWFQLDSGSWIAAFLVTPNETTAAPPAATAPTGAAPIANGVANLRAGPGTEYARVGGTQPNEELAIVARNEASDWYQIASGAWIAGFLVDNAPADLPVASAPAAAPVAATEPAGTAQIVIQYVNYDGAVYRVESDEYAVIANRGTATANLRGWRLNAGDNGQDFYFPDFELAPGASCRVYTNEYHPDSGGFSFGSGRAIWNNKGDCGLLFDAGGGQADRYCY